ncbi:signal peptidase I [Patescibacteria group bacterium]|nr:signal peptidase I [Patescibacteria group bacterium]MBU2543451.1 signal peptidase I [Patescibacteria group bacterium]
MCIQKLVSNLVLTISLLLAILLLIPLIPVVDQWYQLAIVKSGSMEPSLPVGSIAIYKAQATYSPGEVIAYQVGDGGDSKLVIHRIVAKQTKDNQITYLTQGDATAYLSAQSVFAGQVKGKLMGSIPQVGYALSWFRSREGIGVMIFMLLALLIINELTKLL